MISNAAREKFTELLELNILNKEFDEEQRRLISELAEEFRAHPLNTHNLKPDTEQIKAELYTKEPYFVWDYFLERVAEAPNDLYMDGALIMLLPVLDDVLNGRACGSAA